MFSYFSKKARFERACAKDVKKVNAEIELTHKKIIADRKRFAKMDKENKIRSKEIDSLLNDF